RACARRGARLLENRSDERRLGLRQSRQLLRTGWPSEGHLQDRRRSGAHRSGRPEPCLLRRFRTRTTRRDRATKPPSRAHLDRRLRSSPRRSVFRVGSRVVDSPDPKLTSNASPRRRTLSRASGYVRRVREWAAEVTVVEPLAWRLIGTCAYGGSRVTSSFVPASSRSSSAAPSPCTATPSECGS